MTVKIKLKGINEYSLNGVQKIVLDEEYLSVTIFDTRKIRRSYIEKIQVVGDKE